ncbi:MAG: transglutaminase family protein [Pirellulales bacterium]
MIYLVVHRTAYRYQDPVSITHNQAHLVPRSTAYQTCISSELRVEPIPSMLDPWRDAFGNTVHFFSLAEPHKKLDVTATSVVDVVKPTIPSPTATWPWEEVRAACATPRDEETLAASQFIFESSLIKRIPESLDFAAPLFTPGRPLLAAVLDLTERIYREFKYRPGSTSVHTSTSEVFAQRQGVCQDFAHLQISCLRALGLPARYISGYLLTEPPPGQPKLVGVDASHAWVSVYFPDIGWLDFDPTNNQMPSERHVTLAWGRDFADVSPMRGVFLGGGRHSVHVQVDVSPKN